MSKLKLLISALLALFSVIMIAFGAFFVAKFTGMIVLIILGALGFIVGIVILACEMIY